MVFTIEEILEKSRRDANGVTFEEALKHTSEMKLSLKLHKFIIFSLQQNSENSIIFLSSSPASLWRALSSKRWG